LFVLEYQRERVDRVKKNPKVFAHYPRVWLMHIFRGAKPVEYISSEALC
jgi:hypothetical protein